MNLLPQRVLSTHSKQDARRVEAQKSLQVRGDRYGEGWRQDVLGVGRVARGKRGQGVGNMDMSPSQS